jgi:hypothetical protein
MNAKTVSIIVKADGSQAQHEAKKTGDAFVGMTKRAAQQAQSIGQSFQLAGASLTAAFTAPLGALATFGIKAALELDASRTKLTALLGSSEAAMKRIKALQDLSKRSVGVTQKGAMSIDTALRSAGLRTDATIDKMIGSIGKLNAAFKIEDQDGFIRNMSQIFSQGFEMPDIKEAIGRVPIFRDVLIKAFGTDDNEKLKALKESGKMTLDSFMTGLSDAIENTPAIANVAENLSTKLEKGLEKANVALAPLGDIILSTVVPAMSAAVPYIQALAAYFVTLSPAIQTAVVAFGALVAAIGPALVIIGGIASGIGGIVEAFGAIAAAAAVVGGVGPALVIIVAAAGQLAAIAGVVYAAWISNFGGIRDLIEVVADAIVVAWEGAVAAVRDLTSDALIEVSQLWEENGADILAAVQAISGPIKSSWEAVVEFWRDNSETIKSVSSAAWSAVKAVVVGGIRAISAAIKLVASIIKGDWSGAWEATKRIVSVAWSAIVSIINAQGALVVGAVKLAFNAIWALGSSIMAEAERLGRYLGEGLKKGISSMVSSVAEAARDLITSPLNIFRSVPKIQSPSKVTTEIGEFLGEGLAIGLENKKGRARAAAKKTIDESIKQLDEARKEFAKLAGASPDQVGRIQQKAAVDDAVAAQQKILEFRRELGVGSKAMPTTIGDTQKELQDLERMKAEGEALKKLAEELQAYEDARFEAFEKRKQTMVEAGAIEKLNMSEELDLIGVTSDAEKLRIQNGYEILKLRGDMKADGFIDSQIAEAEEIARGVQAVRTEWQRLADVKKQVVEASNLEKDLQGELEALQRCGREASVYEQTLKELNTTMVDISPAQRQRILDIAAEIDATKELKKQQEQLRDVIGTLVDAGFENGFKGILDSVRSMFKNWLKKMLTDFLTSQFSKIFNFGGTSGAGSSSSGGGLFGGLNIPGLGGLGASGSGGTPPLAGSGGPFGFLQTGGLPGAPGSPSTQGSSSGTGGFLKSLTGAGGLFAPKENILTGKTSKTAGYMNGIGAIMAMAGGAIGGRFGNVLGMAGQGMAIGSMFGPWGAAIGAAAGGLIGLFMGDPKRKEDKNKNMPALHKGFSDSVTEIENLVRDVRRLAADPDQAISRAREIRASVANGFDINFLSKKYKKIAQSEIKTKLAQIDAMMKELEGVADMARAAGDRQRRMIPEFANGGLPTPGQVALVGEKGPELFVPNVGGRVITNRETEAMLAGSSSSSSRDDRPISIPISLQIDRDGLVKGYATSPDGRRVLVDIVQTAYKNDDLKLKRR